MPVSNTFPHNFREEGGTLGTDGMLYQRLTGVAQISATPSGSTAGLALLNSLGLPLALPAVSAISDIKFRYINRAGNPLVLSGSGVIKIATAANADATSTSVPAAVGRNEATQAALAAATSFAVDTVGYSAIPLGGFVANAASTPLLLFARDAAAAGTTNRDLSCADGLGLVAVELYCITRLTAARFDGYTLSEAMLTALTPVITQ
jgi:hypothetical protein